MRERERERENRGEDCLHNCGGEREVRTVCIAVGMREREEEDCLHHSGYERGEEGIGRNTGEAICFTVGMRVRGWEGETEVKTVYIPVGVRGRKREEMEVGTVCINLECTVWKGCSVHFSIQFGSYIICISAYN